MTNENIENIISQLKNKEIGILDIPIEYRDCREIVKAERKLRLRRYMCSGFDIITNTFFIEDQIFYEDISKTVTLHFSEWEEYRLFLNDICNQKSIGSILSISISHI